MWSSVCKIVAFLYLFIATVISQQPAENDYSSMFMVCSPVYSRRELQKILETSINSLAFQIPVNPLQKLKVSSLSKLNSNLNEIPGLQNSHSLSNQSSGNQPPSNQSSIDENAKRQTTTRQPEKEALTTPLPAVTTEPTTTVQPISSTPTNVHPATSTTMASPTTVEFVSTTSQAPSTLPSSTAGTPTTARPVRARPPLKRYTNYYRPSPSTTTFVPNTVISTTESPSVELNPQPKPAMAKIRSRLFNLFQPRPFNSNILHKPRTVDYPTLTPQSLFSLNPVNSNSVIQSSSTTTGRPAPSNRLIYSSTESYPQIQSSLLPQSAGEQSNAQATTSSPVDGLLKTKEDLTDKSKHQPTNDNLLAVASSSRFHSVLNSNREKVADKLEKPEKAGSEPIKEAAAKKQSEDKLSDKVDHFKNLSDNLKESDPNANEKHAARDKESKEEAALTGPLNLDEIFSDFGESNEANGESSTASSLAEKEASKKSIRTESVDKSDAKPDQAATNNDHAIGSDPSTESSIDEGDGLIVRKISDVIESISDEPNERIVLNDGLDAGDNQPRTVLPDPSDSKSPIKDNDRQDRSPSRPEGQAKSTDSLKDVSRSDKQPDRPSTDRASKPNNDNPEKSTKFIEVPTIDQEERAKKERLTREQLMKSPSEKSPIERPLKAVKEQSTGAQSATETVRTDKSIASYQLESDKSASDKSVSDRAESGRVESEKIVGDKTANDNKAPNDKPASDKPENDKSTNEKSGGSRPAEVTERFVEDTPDEQPTTNEYETTTAKLSIDDESKLNSYTYPIEYMI